LLSLKFARLSKMSGRESILLAAQFISWLNRYLHLVKMDRNFRVGSDYQVVDVVGEGAYGQCFPRGSITEMRK